MRKAAAEKPTPIAKIGSKNFEISHGCTIADILAVVGRKGIVRYSKLILANLLV